MSERIYVDFNTMAGDFPSEEPRVWIHPTSVKATFRTGMQVPLFDEEMEAHRAPAR